MTKQVIVIGGGDSFNTYEEYVSSLKNCEVTIDKFRPKKDWKTNLPQRLGEDYDVLLPRMPNSANSRYNEWKIWSERMFTFLNNEVVLIGHSLGAMFLIKYLSENTFPKQIKKLFLVSSPYGENIEDPELVERTADLAEFKPPESFDRLGEQIKNVFIFHSKDDMVVPFSEFAEIKKRLPQAQVFVFEDRGHFNQEEFPELVELIRQ